MDSPGYGIAAMRRGSYDDAAASLRPVSIDLPSRGKGEKDPVSDNCVIFIQCELHSLNSFRLMNLPPTSTSCSMLFAVPCMRERDLTADLHKTLRKALYRVRKLINNLLILLLFCSGPRVRFISVQLLQVRFRSIWRCCCVSCHPELSVGVVMEGIM